VTIPKQTNFHINCLVFACIHPIFIVSRIPIFILYAVLTCCCDKGDTLDDDFPYDHTLLSFNYIEKKTEELEHIDEGVARNPFNEWRQRQNINEERIRVQNERSQRLGQAAA
jgi:hypothetical protein